MLSDRFRCLAPDHIGCGRSDKPPLSLYSYSLANRIDDLESWLDGLGIRSGINLVLHDWGGMIGLAYAARHPERIRSLVILNTAGFTTPKGKKLPWQIRLAQPAAWTAADPWAEYVFPRGSSAMRGPQTNAPSCAQRVSPAVR